MSKEAPEWRQFEEAVTRFVKALGSGAKVTHDVQLPDVHTGYPRQRDIWIELQLGGLFGVRALVSCKHWGTQLNEQDIDHFNGEFLSSGANVGIIYALKGFNDRAIAKARKLGFYCCKLYQNEPADLPESLLFGMAYNLRPKGQLRIRGDFQSYRFETWKDVLDMQTQDTTVGKVLMMELDKFQRFQHTNNDWKYVKEGYVGLVEFREPDSVPFDVEILCSFRVYEAKIECVMLDGTYNMTSGQYVGTQATPAMDTQSAHPGPGWKEVFEFPERMPRSLVTVFFSNVECALGKFGSQPFVIDRASEGSL